MLKTNQFHHWIQQALDDQKITNLTSIQTQAIPLILKNQNVIGIAPTGTGKTLAFLLPIFQRLDFSRKLQAIIVAPTRELARQIYSKALLFKKYNANLNLKLLIGGEAIKSQINASLLKSQVLIATPTRLKEVVKENALDFSQIKTLVFDEADMLMDLGFVDDLDFINQTVAKLDVQKISFSATLHEMLSIQLAKYFKNTKIVNVSNSIYDNDRIKHYIVHNNDKEHALAVITKTINPYLCIIFANTKKEVEKIYKYLLSLNKDVTILHGSLPQRQRKNNYKQVKNNQHQYVVASDIASRGLDIDGASHIINWNLPQEDEWYVHRAGRSGRGKYTGESYVLYDQKDDDQLIRLQKKGITFEHKMIKLNNLVDKKYRLVSKKVVDFKTQNEIKKLVQTSSKIVKPGYKKKLKTEIKKIQQKNKRAHIEKKMNAARIRGYKLANANKNNKK